jgi:hypothetical protein
MISPIPMLLPFSVDRATIENAISNLKVESTDGHKEELRYKLVGISLEILTD